MPIIKDLHVSITEGSAPLVVGFFLDGPTIAHRKRWHFGDGSPVEDNNLIHTHRYEKEGIYEDKIYVEIIDENNRILDTSRKFTIRVKPRIKIINGFSQWQGVIYEGDSVGFSIAHEVLGKPEIMWVWNKEENPQRPDPANNKLNPHHKYTTTGTHNGNVTVDKSASKEFAVMVLPYPLKKKTGHIDVSSMRGAGESSEFPVNEELIFDAQIGIDFSKHSPVWHIFDSNGKIVKIPDNLGPTFKHTFVKKDSYLVKCNMEMPAFWLVLSKTIVIQ